MPEALGHTVCQTCDVWRVCQYIQALQVRREERLVAAVHGHPLPPWEADKAQIAREIPVDPAWAPEA